MATHKTTAGVPVDESDQPPPYPGPHPGESNARAVRHPHAPAHGSKDEPLSGEAPPAEAPSPATAPATEGAPPATTRPRAPRARTAPTTPAVKAAEKQARRRVGKHKA